LIEEGVLDERGVLLGRSLVKIPIHFRLGLYTRGQADGAIVGKEVPSVGAKRLRVT